MRANVKLSCGHTETVNVYGNSEARQARIEHLKHNAVCTECYKAAKLRQAQQVEARYRLPDLIGTQEQISFARGIRSDVIALITDTDTSIEDIQQLTSTQRDKLAACCIQGMLSKDKAKYWINNRNEPLTIIKDTYINAQSLLDLVSA